MRLSLNSYSYYFKLFGVISSAMAADPVKLYGQLRKMEINFVVSRRTSQCGVKVMCRQFVASIL